MHRIFSGNGWVVFLSSRKPALDHRPTRLLVQQPLLLFILSILSIDVHSGENIDPHIGVHSWFFLPFSWMSFVDNPSIGFRQAGQSPCPR